MSSSQKQTIQCYELCYWTRLLRFLGGGVRGYSCIIILVIHVLLEIQPWKSFLSPQECMQGDVEAAADRQNMPRNPAQPNIFTTQSPSWVTPTCISFTYQLQKKTFSGFGGKQGLPAGEQKQLRTAHECWWHRAICQSQLSVFLCKEKLLTGGIQHLPNPVVSGTSFVSVS